MKYLTRLLIVGFCLVGFGGGCYSPTAVSALKKDTEYQTVILDNGQMYFGKLASDDGQFLVLTDIYYLQSNANTAPAANTKEPDLSLIKFGGELYGPTDRMQINRDHVLYVEDLQENSKVVQAIHAYKQK